MKKKVIFIIALFLTFVGTFGYLTRVNYVNALETFAGDGYILVASSDNDNDALNEQCYFTAGTAYKKSSFDNKIVFNDANDNKVAIDTNNFIHYSNESLASLSNSVLLDTDEIDGNGQISYYALSKKSTLEKTANAYSTSNAGKTIDFSNFVWKLSSEKYMVVSNTITLVVSETSQQTFDKYIELQYNDEGVASLVNQDGTYLTISSDAYLLLENGVRIYLGTKNISDGENILVNLTQMVVNSDDNIEIIPDEEYKKENLNQPQIIINATDGENGINGENGKDSTEIGEAGKPGISATNGLNGSSGLNAYQQYVAEFVDSNANAGVKDYASWINDKNEDHSVTYEKYVENTIQNSNVSGLMTYEEWYSQLSGSTGLTPYQQYVLNYKNIHNDSPIEDYKTWLNDSTKDHNGINAYEQYIAETIVEAGISDLLTYDDWYQTYNGKGGIDGTDGTDGSDGNQGLTPYRQYVSNYLKDSQSELKDYQTWINENTDPNATYEQYIAESKADADSSLMTYSEWLKEYNGASGTPGGTGKPGANGSNGQSADYSGFTYRVDSTPEFYFMDLDDSEREKYLDVTAFSVDALIGLNQDSICNASNRAKNSCVFLEPEGTTAEFVIIDQSTSSVVFKRELKMNDLDMFDSLSSAAYNGNSLTGDYQNSQRIPFAGLKQNTQYVIAVNAKFKNSASDEMRLQTVLSKVFTTNSFGFDLEPKEIATTEANLKVEFNNEVIKGINSFQIQIFKEENGQKVLQNYNELGGVDLSKYNVTVLTDDADNDGNVMKLAPTTTNSQIDGPIFDVTKLNPNKANGNFEITLSNLEKNTQYYAKIKIVSSKSDKAIPVNAFPYVEFKTLKDGPTISEPQLTYTLKDNSIVVKPGNISDPYNSIVEYRYDFYKKGTAEKIYSVTRSDAYQFNVPVGDSTGIVKGPDNEYYCVANAIYFDNGATKEVSSLESNIIHLDNVSEWPTFEVNFKTYSGGPNKNKSAASIVDGHVTIKDPDNIIDQGKYITVSIKNVNQGTNNRVIDMSYNVNVSDMKTIVNASGGIEYDFDFAFDALASNTKYVVTFTAAKINYSDSDNNKITANNYALWSATTETGDYTPIYLAVSNKEPLTGLTFSANVYFTAKDNNRIVSTPDSFDIESRYGFEFSDTAKQLLGQGINTTYDLTLKALNNISINIYGGDVNGVYTGPQGEPLNPSAYEIPSNSQNTVINRKLNSSNYATDYDFYRDSRFFAVNSETNQVTNGASNYSTIDNLKYYGGVFPETFVNAAGGALVEGEFPVIATTVGQAINNLDFYETWLAKNVSGSYEQYVAGVKNGNQTYFSDLDVFDKWFMDNYPVSSTANKTDKAVLDAYREYVANYICSKRFEAESESYVFTVRSDLFGEGLFIENLSGYQNQCSTKHTTPTIYIKIEKATDYAGNTIPVGETNSYVSSDSIVDRYVEVTAIKSKPISPENKSYLNYVEFSYADYLKDTQGDGTHASKPKLPSNFSANANNVNTAQLAALNDLWDSKGIKTTKDLATVGIVIKDVDIVAGQMTSSYLAQFASKVKYYIYECDENEVPFYANSTDKSLNHMLTTADGPFVPMFDGKYQYLNLANYEYELLDTGTSTYNPVTDVSEAGAYRIKSKIGENNGKYISGFDTNGNPLFVDDAANATSISFAANDKLVLATDWINVDTSSEIIHLPYYVAYFNVTNPVTNKCLERGKTYTVVAEVTLSDWDNVVWPTNDIDLTIGNIIKREVNVKKIKPTIDFIEYQSNIDLNNDLYYAFIDDVDDAILYGPDVNSNKQILIYEDDSTSGVGHILSHIDLYYYRDYVAGYIANKSTTTVKTYADWSISAGVDPEAMSYENYVASAKDSDSDAELLEYADWKSNLFAPNNPVLAEGYSVTLPKSSTDHEYSYKYLLSDEIGTEESQLLPDNSKLAYDNTFAYIDVDFDTDYDEIRTYVEYSGLYNADTKNNKVKYVAGMGVVPNEAQECFDVYLQIKSPVDIKTSSNINTGLLEKIELTFENIVQTLSGSATVEISLDDVIQVYGWNNNEKVIKTSVKYNRIANIASDSQSTFMIKPTIYVNTGNFGLLYAKSEVSFNTQDKTNILSVYNRLQPTEATEILGWDGDYGYKNKFYTSNSVKHFYTLYAKNLSDENNLIRSVDLVKYLQSDSNKNVVTIDSYKDKDNNIIEISFDENGLSMVPREIVSKDGKKLTEGVVQDYIAPGGGTISKDAGMNFLWFKYPLTKGNLSTAEGLRLEYYYADTDKWYPVYQMEVVDESGLNNDGTADTSSLNKKVLDTQKIDFSSMTDKTINGTVYKEFYSGIVLDFKYAPYELKNYHEYGGSRPEDSFVNELVNGSSFTETELVNVNIDPNTEYKFRLTGYYVSGDDTAGYEATKKVIQRAGTDNIADMHTLNEVYLYIKNVRQNVYSPTEGYNKIDRDSKTIVFKPVLEGCHIEDLLRGVKNICFRIYNDKDMSRPIDEIKISSEEYVKYIRKHYTVDNKVTIKDTDLIIPGFDKKDFEFEWKPSLEHIFDGHNTYTVVPYVEYKLGSKENTEVEYLGNSKSIYNVPSYNASNNEEFYLTIEKYSGIEKTSYERNYVQFEINATDQNRLLTGPKNGMVESVRYIIELYTTDGVDDTQIDFNLTSSASSSYSELQNNLKWVRGLDGLMHSVIVYDANVSGRTVSDLVIRHMDATPGEKYKLKVYAIIDGKNTGGYVNTSLYNISNEDKYLKTLTDVTETEKANAAAFEISEGTIKNTSSNEYLTVDSTGILALTTAPDSNWKLSSKNGSSYTETTVLTSNGYYRVAYAKDSEPVKYLKFENSKLVLTSEISEAGVIKISNTVTEYPVIKNTGTKQYVGSIGENVDVYTFSDRLEYEKGNNKTKSLSESVITCSTDKDISFAGSELDVSKNRIKIYGYNLDSVKKIVYVVVPKDSSQQMSEQYVIKSDDVTFGTQYYADLQCYYLYYDPTAIANITGKYHIQCYLYENIDDINAKAKFNAYPEGYLGDN